MTSRCCWLIQPATATMRNCNGCETGSIEWEPIKAVRVASLIWLRPTIPSGPRQIGSRSIEFLDNTPSAANAWTS